MTERLSDIEARIGTVGQLSAVITAMRGIAATRTAEARRTLEAIRAYGEEVAEGISEALRVTAPEEADTAPRPDEVHAVIAFCSEQGFVGAFNDHILDAFEATPHTGPRVLFLIGDRGRVAAAERDLTIDWFAPMIAHPTRAPRLANRLADALFEQISAGRVQRVTMIHAAPERQGGYTVQSQRLVPFDYVRFPPRAGPGEMLLTLPPAQLLRKLVEEYIFAMLCEAAMLSFAAENEARMRAMIAARQNVADVREGLQARARQLRQEEITSEIIALASSRL
ncbi:MAG: FoF1 ATP synthase subunit gamma [Paracoccaceae bacterium]